MQLEDFARETGADAMLGMFVHLNRTRYDVSPTLTVVGCTLWSSLNPADLDILSYSLNDFRCISFLSPRTYSQLHQTDLAWLNAIISSIATEEPQREIVVFTHHAPTIQGSSDPKYEGHPTNSAFATELTRESCWTSGKVKLWAFGHTHWSCDFERGGVRVYSNQRGYQEGAGGYSPGRVLDLH